MTIPNLPTIPRYPFAAKLGAAAVTVAAMTGMVLVVLACVGTPVQQAKYVKAETDLCKARAAYRLLAASANGMLDPMPGSPRAQLEAAEDALCLVVPAPSVSAPPEAGVPK